MSKTNIGCPTCGVIGPHFHSWQADMGTLSRVAVKVNVAIVVPPPQPERESGG